MPQPRRRRHLPPPEPPERMTAFLGLHLKPSDRAKLEAMAARSGRNLSDFARDVLLSLNHEPPAPRLTGPALQAVLALVAQFGRLGNNVNQLARWANEHKLLPAQKSLDQMLDLLKLCTEKVIAL